MSSWTKEELFDNGGDYFESLLLGIKNAKTSIDLESYIFNKDEVGCSIVQSLNEAALRGIKVRVMVDGVGCSLGSIRYLEHNLDPKIRQKVFHPMPWFFFWGRFHWSRFVHFFLGINRRNHRKTCIIDGKTAWLGSMNLCKRTWRETGVRVEGQEVNILTHAFIRTWEKAGFSVSHHIFDVKRSSLVRINDTWAMRRHFFRDLLHRIEKAKDRIWITNAYFVPHFNLVRAISKAARAGVDVRIVVPRNCDISFIPLVRAAFYGGLIESGARIFEYLPTMLHAKTLLIDNWGMLGSSNLNHRSLHHDLEADIVLTHPHSKDLLRNQFLKDMRNSEEVTVFDVRNQGWLQTGSGRALLLLKNWM